MDIKHSLAAAGASAALVTVTAFGAVAAGGSHAGEPTSSDSCAAKWQPKIEAAEQKLARSLTVFAKAKKAEARAERALERADSKAEKREARQELAETRADKAKAAKVKKAHVRQLAHFQQKLEDCEASASPSPSESPVESGTPTDDPTATETATP